MRRTALAAAIATAAVLGTGVAQGELKPRVTVYQSGGFTIIGNTLGHDCAKGVPEPIVGEVGSCGNWNGDSAPDVYWSVDPGKNPPARANKDIKPDDARSIAVLEIPDGATVTHAFVYWAAILSDIAASNAKPDTEIILNTPKNPNAKVKAIQSWEKKTIVGHFYHAVGDVTDLVKTGGAGAYQASGIYSWDFRDKNTNAPVAAWSMVVFYNNDSTEQYSLSLLDGFEQLNSNSVTTELKDFFVPKGPFKAQLGVIAYEGDHDTAGDNLRFGTGSLSDADNLIDEHNPKNNFFNGSRTWLGKPRSVKGDLPQLTGTPNSMSGIDIDVIDISNKLKPGDNKAQIQATTALDQFFIGAIVTSIPTVLPAIIFAKKSNEIPQNVKPGDTVSYTIEVKNTGHEVAFNVSLRDPLPKGVTYVPGSMSLKAGSMSGAITDAKDNDVGHYDSATRTIHVNLGEGATSTKGGILAVDKTSILEFKATVDADAAGDIVNQAFIHIENKEGTLKGETSTDADPDMPGTQGTVFSLACSKDTDCPVIEKPYCDTTSTPAVCVGCTNSAQCPQQTPICDSKKRVCRTCENKSDCPATNPICHASGMCVECDGGNDGICAGKNLECNVETGACVQCVADDDCKNKSEKSKCYNGVCLEGCDNDEQCKDLKLPYCRIDLKLCVSCRTSSDCSGKTPTCDETAYVCVCTSDADCGNDTSSMMCEAGACVTGCRGQQGNGCPDGQQCTSRTPVIGECRTVDAGAGGQGGNGQGGNGKGGQSGQGGDVQGGHAGAAGQSPHGGAAGTQPPALDAEGNFEGGGWDCGLQRHPTSTFGWALLASLFGIVSLIRRKTGSHFSPPDNTCR